MEERKNMNVRKRNKYRLAQGGCSTTERSSSGSSTLYLMQTLPTWDSYHVPQFLAARKVPLLSCEEKEEGEIRTNGRLSRKYVCTPAHICNFQLYYLSISLSNLFPPSPSPLLSFLEAGLRGYSYSQWQLVVLMCVL